MGVRASLRQAARRVIRRRNDTLLTILEALPGALFVVDDAATIVYANASVQAMLGATRVEVCGQSLWRCAPHLVSTPLYQAIQKARRRKQPPVDYYIIFRLSFITRMLIL